MDAVMQHLLIMRLHLLFEELWKEIGVLTLVAFFFKSRSILAKRSMFIIKSDLLRRI